MTTIERTVAKLLELKQLQDLRADMRAHERDYHLRDDEFATSIGMVNVMIASCRSDIQSLIWEYHYERR
jgi:hypothetical protein